MTQYEIEVIAKAAAREAVRETLETFGFDIANPREVQQDQSFVRTLRVGTFHSVGVAIKSAILGMLTVIGGWIYLGFMRSH